MSMRAAENADTADMERSLRAAITERDAALEAAQQAIVDRNARNATLKQQVEILSNRLEKEGASLAERDADLEAAHTENAELRQALVAKTCVIKGLREELDSANRLHEGIAQERDDLRTSIAEAVADIERLEKGVEDARAATGTLNSEHIRQRARIVDLERQGASYRTAIRQLCAALELSTKAINELTDVTGEDIPF